MNLPARHAASLISHPPSLIPHSPPPRLVLSLPNMRRQSRHFPTRPRVQCTHTDTHSPRHGVLAHLAITAGGHTHTHTPCVPNTPAAANRLHHRLKQPAQQRKIHSVSLPASFVFSRLTCDDISLRPVGEANVLQTPSSRGDTDAVFGSALSVTAAPSLPTGFYSRDFDVGIFHESYYLRRKWPDG